MNFHSALAVLSSTLVLSISAQAGGFGGPGPFRNGSPLPTGTDGVYSAVANGTNLTGYFSFSLRGGVQTAGTRGNSWVFFVDGQTLRGSVTANAANGKVVGILDSGVSTALTNSDGSLELPAILYIPGNSANGDFEGKLNTSSPTGYFDGKGQMAGFPARTDQIIAINTTGGNGTGNVNVILTAVPIPGSTLGQVDFKFRGTRLSTTTSTTQSTPSSD
jgi:hypothetical protein